MSDLPAPTAEDVDTLARTLWAEARGEGHRGMQAVANVIVNRAKHPRWWGGPSIKSVCRKPAQFSCWLSTDPNRDKLLKVTSADPAFVDAYNIANLACKGLLVDLTNGCDSYFVKDMPNPPKWSVGKKPVMTIGAHAFYRMEI